MSTFLEIDGVTKQFSGLTAVDQMRFSLDASEIVGLLGPNGSGKTTLLNLISGALKPTKGSIRIRSDEIAGRRPDQIAQEGIARTFQLVRILPSMSVLDNVKVPAAFGAKKHWGAAIDHIATESLEAVGMVDKAGLIAGDLTYIDQKRLELARALAAEPNLLLLDEWLAGLNPTELQEGIALIRSLQSTGITILLVEHIMDAVRALCPRCVVMNAGKLIADGPTEAVLSDKAVIDAYLGEVHA